jgi:ferredoxin
MSVKIFVDTEKCQHYGQCTFEAPDLFRLDDDNTLIHATEADDARLAEIESATDACPMQAITVEV